MQGRRLSSFKVYLESGIAHVGATPDDGGGLYDSDRSHLDAVTDWLGKNDPQFFEYIVKAPQDHVELDMGRDFLLENRQYDLVILHHIYAAPYGHGNAGGGHGVGLFRTSPNHSPEEWRTRLSNCGAKYIFAFGGSTEVSGDYLGNIPMYFKVESSKLDKGRFNYSPGYTVYIKATSQITRTSPIQGGRV